MSVTNGQKANAATFNAAFVSKTVQTTKGDLIGRSTTDPVRIPVGADGQVLTADSTQSSGVKWANASGGGGGGGGSLQWIEDINAPLAAIENKTRVYLFNPGSAQELHAAIRVPSSYQAGTQIKILILWYSGDSSGTGLLQSVSTLIRTGVDQVTSTTNQRTSTNSAVTLSAGTQNEPQAVELDLTSASGQINSVSVSAGDLIFVRLTRGTDTATGEIKFLPYAAEVKAS